MPYAVTSDKVRLYFEEAEAGHPSSSCMNSRPTHQLGAADAVFLARDRCIAYQRAATRHPMGLRHQMLHLQHFYRTHWPCSTT